MRVADQAGWVRAAAPLTGAAALLLAASLPAAPALGQEAMVRLAQQGYSRDVDGAAVSTTISLANSGALAPGGHLTLQIDIETSLAEAAPQISAAMLNGLVEVALPPGLEPDGKTRLYYYDEAKGAYQFMYSRDYPVLERLGGLEEAFGAAAGNSPEAIYGGLSQVALALDRDCDPTGPLRPEINGQDSDYAVTGITWLLPANMLYKPVVDLFATGGGLQRSIAIRVSVPLRVTEAVTAPIVVYAGGLSAATRESEVEAAKLPPTAIPLGPLPDLGAAAGTPPPADSAAPAGKQKPPPPAGASQPQAVEPGPAAPPAVVPALLCSYDWIAWETEIAPAQLGATRSTAKDGAPLRPTEAEPPAALPAEPGRDAGDTVDAPAAPEAPEQSRLNRARPLRQDPPPPDPAGGGEAADAAPEAEETSAAAPAQAEGVKEVAPGTLGDEPELYTVPLKPITGAAGHAPGAAEPALDQAAGGPITFGERTAEGPGRAPGGAPLPGMDEMVLIPAGDFLLGTGGNSSAGDADELPQASVYLPDYYIDKYPVLNRQFYEFVVASGYKAKGNWEKYYTTATANDPVRGVTWDDAGAYAKWARKRLPTEAEWEKAARGADGRTYPWGEAWSSDLLPREENLYRVMTAEGTASPYGVMGMVGVVWQWTASSYTSGYPFDPNAAGEKRVLRGGAYSNGRNIVRCANRYAESPNVPLNTFGFRCVKDTR